MTYLSTEINEIKKFNRFGLIEISEHAKQRLIERGFSEDIIMQCISRKSTTIIQHHAPGTYRNNKNEIFVLYGKFIFKNQSNPLHIIIAKDLDVGKKYKVVTCYIPSKEIFYAYGRKLKR